jgi:hypothetical protein
MDIPLVRKYLLHIRLTTDKDTLMCVDDTIHVQLDISLGHIAELVLVHSSDPVIEFVNERKGVCMMYLMPSLPVIDASLKVADESVMSLMHRDILVLHVEGILCNIMHDDLCTYSYVPSSDVEEVDRLNIIDCCTSDVEHLVSPRGFKPIVLVEPFSVYYHNSADVLGVLGVEYPLCIYKPLISLGVDPSSTIYIAISARVAHAIRVT